MSNKNLVITIGRQYGSGGREVGQCLARRLGVAYYDKKLVHLAAEKSGFSSEAFTKQNEGVASGFAWLFSYATSGTTRGGVPMDDQLFIAQSAAIKDIATERSCVLVGRCADYVLSDMHDEMNIVDIFLYSTTQARINRIAQRNNLTLDEAEARMKHIAPRRATYYERYTDRKWGDPENYHLSMDTTGLSPDAVAAIIVEYIIARGFVQREDLPLDPAEPRTILDE